MKDVTFGVKVTPEFKEKVDELIKNSDFETQKEWFQHLITSHEYHQLKQQDGTKKYSNDLDYIDQNLSRIQETIILMMKKTTDDVAHQEAESMKELDKLRQQLQHSEQLRNELKLQNADIEGKSNEYKKSLADIQKQSSVREELCFTLKKSLSDKEEVIVTLLKERSQWISSDHLIVIQQLKEDIQVLQQQSMKHRYEMDFLRMEYEKKFEVEQYKLQLTMQQHELLISPLSKLTKETQDEPPRKRGRPKKENVNLSNVDLQQLTTDDFEYNEDEQEEFIFPTLSDEDLIEFLGDEPLKTEQE